MTLDQRQRALIDVEVASERVDDAVDARAAAIVAAAAYGWSYRDIAGAARLTHPTVAKIVRAYTRDTGGGA